MAVTNASGIGSKQQSQGRGYIRIHFSTTLVEIQNLIDVEGIDVNAADFHGDSPLIHASAQAKPELVSFLLLKGADPNYQNSEGETALHFAAHQGDHQSITFLLEKDAQVNICSHHGYTPLHNSIWKRHFKASSLLLKANANANLQTNPDKFTSLHIACIPDKETHKPADMNILALLLQFGADVRIQDANGSLPIHYYCRCYGISNTNLNDFKILVRACNSTEQETKQILKPTDGNGDTLLHIAATNGNLEIVKLILTWDFMRKVDNWPHFKLDSVAVNKFGRTALHNAVIGGNFEIVKLLAGVYISPSIMDFSNKIAADYTNDSQVIHYLQMIQQQSK